MNIGKSHWLTFNDKTKSNRIIYQRKILKQQQQQQQQQQ
jgi:hypothetical protein